MVGVRPDPVILWLRRDLRLADNPALDWALASGQAVIPVYVHDEALEERPLGAASRWWLDKSLRALAAALEAAGSRLVLRSGSAPEVLKALADETGAGALTFNRLHDPGAAGREQAVRAAMPGLEVIDFAASWLAEPGTVLTGSGGPYKVFTPFGRALRANLNLPLDGALARSARDVPLWLCHAPGADAAPWTALGADCLACDPFDLARVMTTLASRGITRVFCEGGGSMAASLLGAGLVDELVVFSAGLVIGADGLSGVAALGLTELAKAPRFTLISHAPVGPDLMQVWRPDWRPD